MNEREQAINDYLTKWFCGGLAAGALLCETAGTFAIGYHARNKQQEYREAALQRPAEALPLAETYLERARRNVMASGVFTLSGSVLGGVVGWCWGSMCHQYQRGRWRREEEESQEQREG